MREKILELADSLDLVFMNPIHFPSDWDRDNREWLTKGRWLALLSASSISVGSYLISPPYNSSYITAIVLSTISNFLILLILPFLLGAYLDYLAQSRERKGSAQMMVAYTSIAIAIFLLFVPLTYMFLIAGITGVSGAFGILLILFVFFWLILSRGVKYIYDLKDRDSLKYSFLALGVSFVYPFLFNLYLTTGILNLTL